MGNMPAYFENGVFTDNQPAWHGMGKVKAEAHMTAAEVMEAVEELASDVEKRPVFTLNAEGLARFKAGEAWDNSHVVLVDRHNANTRVFDDKPVGVVGERYKIHQNRHSFDFMDSLLDDGMRYKTAGTLYGGSVVWLLAELPEALKIAGMDSELTNRYILLMNSFDGRGPLKVINTKVRVVCANTLTMAIRGAKTSFNIRHSQSMDGKLAEARKVLGMTFKHDEAFEEIAKEMLDTTFTDEQFKAFLESLVPTKDEKGEEKKGKSLSRAQNIQTDISKVYFGPKYGQQPIKGTVYGAYQSIIAFDQHEATVRTTATSTKEENLFSRVVDPPAGGIVARASKILLPA